MRQLPTIFFFFLFFFFNTALAESLIKIEVKILDGNTICIFYHSNNQILHINSKDNLLTINTDVPSEFTLINPSNFYKFADHPTLSDDKKSINLITKEKFKSNSIINGEKLTAIKFSHESEDNKVLDQALLEMKDQTIVNDVNPSAQNSILEQQVIKYKFTKGEHKISFNLAARNIGTASFFRGKYLWVIFDQNRKFTLEKNKIFTDLIQLESKDSTILRIKIDEYSNVRLIKNGSNLDIVASRHKLRSKGLALNIKNLPNDEGIKIDGNFSNNKIIEFNDPGIGDVIKVIPLRVVNTRIENLSETVDFNVVPTIQGIATIVSSDNVAFIKNNNSLLIISKHNLSSSANDTRSELSAKIQDNKLNEISKSPTIIYNQNNPTLLPILDKKLDIVDFNYNKSRLIFESSLAPNNEVIFAKRFELAKFLFMHGWYHESLAALKLSKNTIPKEYTNNLQAQFLMGVNYTLTGFLEEAKELYGQLLQNINNQQNSEIVLWNNYNEFLIGYHPHKLGFLNNIKFINLYPDNIYMPLAFAEIDLSLLSNDLNNVEMIIKEMRVPEGNFANSLAYYKANYYRKKHKLDLAKQSFQELSKKIHDPFNMVRSGIDLIKLQLTQKEINLTEAIARLNKLRFSWRGDKLEYELLMLIAGYYRDNNDGMKACRTYKYIQNSFSNGISNFYITSEMVKIFNNAFLPGRSSKEMGDFDAVSLFYEFKDLNPIGAEGDEVILAIARRLVNLDLLNKAANLLKHQVRYRLQGEKRIINADFLAIILLMDKKPNEAIKILDETDKDNFKFDEHQYRARLRAKALIDLKKYDDALAYLKDDNSKDTEILKRECFFQAKQWKQYIDLVENEVNKLVGAQIDEKNQQDILRLAVAYNMENNQEALETLLANLDFNNEILKNTIELLISSGSNVDYANLDKSLNINQMELILDKYKNQIFDRK